LLTFCRGVVGASIVVLDCLVAVHYGYILGISVMLAGHC
jgi:sporulation protein YlmC with PRC-barrel domain